jgi:pimeloyl-ACP methyl ester carboxylesterase
MKQYKLNLKNLSINVLENGVGENTIIFIHGNSMSSKIWQTQLADEALTDYRLLALDLPGHGDSSHSTDPDNAYNVLFYGEIIAEFIVETKAQNVILVGHSLGANAVIEALPFINNCKGIVLLSASIVHSAADVAATFLPNPAASIFFNADYIEENVQAFNDAAKSLTNPSLPDFVNDDFRKADKNCRSYLAKSVGENKLSDELGILQKTEMPILLVIGAEDQLIDKEYLKNIALNKWKNQVFEISKAGHCAQFENADGFNTLIDSFCQTLL